MPFQQWQCKGVEEGLEEKDAGGHVAPGKGNYAGERWGVQSGLNRDAWVESVGSVWQGRAGGWPRMVVCYPTL